MGWAAGSLWDLKPLGECFSWKVALGPLGSKADGMPWLCPQATPPFPALQKVGSKALLPAALCTCGKAWPCPHQPGAA